MRNPNCNCDECIHYGGDNQSTYDDPWQEICWQEATTSDDLDEAPAARWRMPSCN